MRDRQGYNKSIPPEKVIKLRKKKLLERDDMIFFFKKLLIVIIALFAIFNLIYGICIVSGQDMYPQIKDGDVVFYFRLDTSYEVSDVVVIKKNKSTYISRIVAQAGDTVDITDDGDLIINGNVQQEEIYFLTYPDEDGITFPYTVSEDSVFVLGDFRTGSTDSRQFGEVHLSEIKGSVITLLRRRSF